jgi:hypothetical protein
MVRHIFKKGDAGLYGKRFSPTAEKISFIAV